MTAPGTSAHHLSGGDARVWQGDLPGSPGGGGLSGEGEVSCGPLCRDRRRRQRELEFLERHTDTQVVDFWHAAEYLGKAAAVLYRGRPATRQSWTEASCHTLRHEPGGAATVLKQLKSLAEVRPWAKDNGDV